MPRTIPAVTRVLTSDGAEGVDGGLNVLRELNALHTAPIVPAGGGVSGSNRVPISRYTGVRKFAVGSGARTPGQTDAAKIRDLASLLRSTYLT